jgi:hypothetical protein
MNKYRYSFDDFSADLDGNFDCSLNPKMTSKIRFFVLLLLCLTSASCFTISCEYDIVEYNEGELHGLHEKSYHCRATVDYICDQSPDSIMGTSKNHMAGKKDADVIFLDFDDQIIKRIPMNVGFFYPNLEVFRCASCAIDQVRKADLEQMPKLTCLYLGKNIIEALSADLLQPVPQLKFFGVDSNIIQCVGLDLFKSLPHLTKITFEQNICYSGNVISEVVAKCEHIPCGVSREVVWPKRDILEVGKSYCDRYNMKRAIRDQDKLISGRFSRSS